MWSIFPALAALIAIYGLVADPGTVQGQIGEIQGIIPAEAQNLIANYLKSILSSSSSDLDIGLIVRTLMALWGARLGL
jgi:membrane protein